MITIAALAALELLSGGASAAPDWTFVAQLDPERETLLLRGCSDRTIDRLELRAGDGAGVYLRRLERGDGGGIEVVDDRARASAWQAGECFRAEVDLAAAGKADRWGLGRAPGSYYRIAPAQWFWRPRRLDPDSSIRFELPEGWSASVPWAPLAVPGAHRLGATPRDWPAQTAFGRFSEQRLDYPGGRLRVSLLPMADPATRDSMRDWFTDNAELLLANDGHLPLPDTQILIVPLADVDAPVPWGQVSRGGGAAVTLFVGAAAGRQRWQADWTLAHELAHLQHPFLGDAGRWLAEGLGSYYQNVWRARSGDLSADEAWRRLDAGFARGRAVGAGPPLSELRRGRGATMRVYWSGAAYWLESDIALRTHGSSLDAALVAFRNAHLPSERAWEPLEFIAALDRTAPAARMLARYHRYAALRDFPDLVDAYDRLGLIPGAVPDGDLGDQPLRDAIMAMPR